MTTGADERNCPVCGSPAVADAPRASACLPLPPIVPLRCERCGNTGTELGLHGRPVIRWVRGRELATMTLLASLACAPAGSQEATGAAAESSSTASTTPTPTSSGESSGSSGAGDSSGVAIDLPPARACNGRPELCERRYDEVVFPCTHNAFAAREAGFKQVNANQNHPIGQQLADGVRCMMLDVSLDGDEAAMCHGPCSFGRLVHLEVADEIAGFMTDHPDEVLTIIYQDDIEQEYIVADLELAGLTALAYVHASGEPWPTLGAMIDSNRRVVVTAESGAPPPDWYHHVWDLTWDTPYTFHSTQEFSCALNRGAQDNDLFLVNHWISTEFDTPSEADAKLVNVYDVLHARAAGCQTETGQLPNFVAVDFYDHGDLFAVVDALNGL